MYIWGVVLKKVSETSVLQEHNCTFVPSFFSLFFDWGREKRSNLRSKDFMKVHIHNAQIFLMKWKCLMALYCGRCLFDCKVVLPLVRQKMYAKPQDSVLVSLIFCPPKNCASATLKKKPKKSTATRFHFQFVITFAMQLLWCSMVVVSASCCCAGVLFHTPALSC